MKRLVVVLLCWGTMLLAVKLSCRTRDKARRPRGAMHLTVAIRIARNGRCNLIE